MGRLQSAECTWWWGVAIWVCYRKVASSRLRKGAAMRAVGKILNLSISRKKINKPQPCKWAAR